MNHHSSIFVAARTPWPLAHIAAIVCAIMVLTTSPRPTVGYIQVLKLPPKGERPVSYVLVGEGAPDRLQQFFEGGQLAGATEPALPCGPRLTFIADLIATECEPHDCLWRYLPHGIAYRAYVEKTCETVFYSQRHPDIPWCDFSTGILTAGPSEPEKEFEVFVDFYDCQIAFIPAVTRWQFKTRFTHANLGVAKLWDDLITAERKRPGNARIMLALRDGSGTIECILEPDEPDESRPGACNPLVQPPLANAPVPDVEELLPHSPANSAIPYPAWKWMVFDGLQCPASETPIRKSIAGQFDFDRLFALPKTRWLITPSSFEEEPSSFTEETAS